MTRIIEGPDGSTCTDGGSPVIRILNEITVLPGRNTEGSSDGREETVRELGPEEARELTDMSVRRREAALNSMIGELIEERGLDIDKSEYKERVAQLARVLDNGRVGDFIGDGLPHAIIIKFKIRWFKKRWQIKITLGAEVEMLD